MYAKTFSKQLTRLGVSAICLLTLAPLFAKNTHASKYQPVQRISMQRKHSRTRVPVLTVHQYARPASYVPYTPQKRVIRRPQNKHIYYYHRYINNRYKFSNISHYTIKFRRNVRHYRKKRTFQSRIHFYRKVYAKHVAKHWHKRRQRKYTRHIVKHHSYRKVKQNLFKKRVPERYRLQSIKRKIRRIVKHRVIRRKVRRKKHVAKKMVRQLQPVNIHFTKPLKVNRNTVSASYRAILKIAKSKLGDAYVWGGNGPRAFDCSGFTKYIFQNGAHKYLDRLAGDQYYNNKHIPASQRRPGDLVFFGTSLNNITHVGLYLGNDKMIDAQLNGVEIEKVTVPWWHAVGYSRPLA